MELKDTIELMNSADYKERFKAEYYQVKIRHEKLQNMIHKYEAGILGFKLDCPIDLLKKQASYMYMYLSILETRAFAENINLWEEN
jgi:hypothetical protein